MQRNNFDFQEDIHLFCISVIGENPEVSWAIRHSVTAQFEECIRTNGIRILLLLLSEQKDF